MALLGRGHEVGSAILAAAHGGERYATTFGDWKIVKVSDYAAHETDELARGVYAGLSVVNISGCQSPEPQVNVNA